MNRALAVLAVSAVVATGCATQGAVNQLRFDVTQVRSELADMRSTQASAGQNAGRATADVQVLDARTRELTGTVRETTDEVARLGARVAVTEEAMRTIRARVEALAMPPPAPPPASPVAPPPAPGVAPPPAPPPARPATPRPAPVVAPQVERRAREPGPGAAERGYAAAMATFRAREHGQAVLDLLDFLARYPRHPLAGNAQYWIGEAYYLQHDYRQALVEFQKVLDLGLGKMPEALVKIGLCHLSLRDANRARQTWQRIVREYPQSESAVAARTLLRNHAAARR